MNTELHIKTPVVWHLERIRKGKKEILWLALIHRGGGSVYIDAPIESIEELKDNIERLDRGLTIMKRYIRKKEQEAGRP